MSSRRPGSANPLLEGVSDALPVEPALELPRLVSHGPLPPPGVQEWRPGQARRARARAHWQEAWRRVGQGLLPLVVLGVALGAYLGSSPPPVPAGEDTLALVRFVEELEPGQRVLLAVEYRPGGAGELEPLLRAVLAHLSMRGTTVLSFSTLPEGAGLARALGEGYQGAWDSLGFFPGGSAGSALAAAQAADVQALLVATDSAAGLQRWVEQVAALRGPPAAAVLSLALQPQGEAYRRSGQLAALAAGLPAAAEYESLLGRVGPGRRAVDGLLALTGLLLGIIVLANLEELARRGRRT